MISLHCETFNLDPCHAKHLSASRASRAPHCSGSPSGGFRRSAGSHCPSARSVSSGASLRERPLTMTNLGGKNPGKMCSLMLFASQDLAWPGWPRSIERHDWRGFSVKAWEKINLYLLHKCGTFLSSFVHILKPTQFHLSSAWTPLGSTRWR